MSSTTTTTTHDPSEGGRPASSARDVQAHQHDDGEATSLLQEEHRHDLRPTTDDPVARDIHSPHAARFEPKEEDWLLGDSGAREGQSSGHVKRGFSPNDEASVDEDGKKCAYCIASDIHAPHLHNARMCTCAYRSAKGVGSSSTEPTTVLNATSSAPRFDPSQLLRRPTHSSDNLVPVNGPGPSVADGGSNRSRCNGTNPLPLSRFSMAGTGAAISKPRLVRSPQASGLPQEAAASIRPTARRDDPKGKRPMAASSPPSPSDLSTAESGSSTESDDDADDDETVAGDADDGQSSHTTAPGPSASVPTLNESRKRRRRDSTVDEPRPRFATASRIHQRRRLERSMQRTGTAPSRRASCGCNLGRSLSSVAEPPLPHGSVVVVETLEQSHRRVRDYLATCFANNQSLRAELVEARRENERLGERVTAAERDAFRYWEERWMET